MRVIFFDIDCLRPDHLGCYGYSRPTSPNIDKVAENGVRFTNYFCATSPCLPSRTEWQSGRYGIRNGVVSNVRAGANFHIEKTHYGGPVPEHQMLMRQLRKAGWDTISFSNFADRHSAWYFMCGFSEFNTPNLKCGGESADEVTPPVLDWLKKNQGRDNYLLHVNFWDTHRCYKMDPVWAERFKDYPVGQQWPDEAAIEKHQSVNGPFTAGRQFKDGKSPFALMPDRISNRADFEHMLTGYDTSIAYVDYHVGLILDELARQNALEDTAIIISSDHGDSFGEHGIYSDHVCSDESIHHIPLIMNFPGIRGAGRECGEMFCNVDLPPTLCDLLGSQEIPANWDGTSFVPQLKGAQGGGRDYMVWHHALYTVQRAVRTRDHLMIRTYDNFGYEFNETELYNIKNDPYESSDIAAEEPAVVKQCEDLMQGWLDEQLSKPDSIPDPIEAVLAERRERRAQQ